MELTTTRFPQNKDTEDQRLVREREVLEQLPALAGWLEAIPSEEPLAS